MQLITLPTHSRWVKLRHKADFHLKLSDLYDVSRHADSLTELDGTSLLSFVRETLASVNFRLMAHGAIPPSRFKRTSA